jgi:hypothetical protein
MFLFEIISLIWHYVFPSEEEIIQLQKEERKCIMNKLIFEYDEAFRQDEIEK